MQISPRILKELSRVLGVAQVQTDPVSLLLNGYDCSPSRHRPDAVLTITNAAQLAQVLQILSREKIPFIPRAAATNHAGSCSAVNGGAVLNLAPLTRLLRIDTQRLRAEAEPGLITAHLQEALSPLGLFYAPDPASLAVCTLGGNFAQNASGARCLKYGNTENNTLAAEFITPDGNCHSLRREDAGPDILGLLAGSEGTLGLVSRLQVKLRPKPAQIKTFLVAFPTLEQSIQTVSDLLAQGLLPRCVEAMDNATLRAVEPFTQAGYPLDAGAVLVLELDGSTAEISRAETILQTLCTKNGASQFSTARTQAQRFKLWKGRRAAYAAMSALAPNIAVGDGTVPPAQLPQALRAVRAVLDKSGIPACLLFHAADGNFHPQIIFDARQAEQYRLAHNALQEVLKTCLQFGGTLSGEHGIGVEKRALMSRQYSRQTLRLFQKIKHAFDPDNLANPGKIIPVGFEEKATPVLPQDPAVAHLSVQLKERFLQAARTLITGRNTQLKTQIPHTISAKQLDKILDIDAANHTATVQAGAAVSAVLRALQQKNLYAALPADYPGSIGGLISTKRCPDFNATLLGVQALLPDGDFISYGGKLMKNAAGYNLCRLFTGAQGALGMITQVTFRIYSQTIAPAPLIAAPQATPSSLFRALKKELDHKGVLLSPAFTAEVI